MHVLFILLMLQKLNNCIYGSEIKIPGYPRYFPEGSESDIHHFRRESTKIGDDVEFLDKVRPSEENTGIPANLTLIAITNSVPVTIPQNRNVSTVKLLEGETITLKCNVAGGKPAASITWYRNNIELKENNVKYDIKYFNNHRENAIGKINFTPTPDDDESMYSCEAINMDLNVRVLSHVKLSVLYPPSSPVIEEYHEGDTTQVGDLLTLKCVSRGGNPLAKLVWFRNEQQIDDTYMTSGTESSNTISFYVQHMDNNAIYRCEAVNSVSLKPMIAKVKLTVHYSPSNLTVIGPTEAKEGDTVTITCTTDRSNPRADIFWVVNGRYTLGLSNSVEDPTGGWITTSNITYTINGHETNWILFACYAVNHELGETKVETTVLRVLFSPSKLTVTGPTEANEGDTVKLTCTTDNSNPPADVTWVVNGRYAPASSSINMDPRGGWTTTSNITYPIRRQETDWLLFACYGVNPALSDTRVKTAAVRVLSPPDPPTITGYIEGTPIKTGTKQELVCISYGGSPLPKLRWLRKDKEITSATTTNNKVVTSAVSITVDSNDNGVEYECESTNSVSVVPMVATVRLTVY